MLIAVYSSKLPFELIICLSVSLLQCGAGLQAAGGQAAAADEEAVPYGGRPLRPAALPPGGLHLHPKTQVQSWLQEARSLETLVPVKTQDHLLLHHRCTGFTRSSGHSYFFWVIHRLPFYHIYLAFCRPGNHWILNPISEMTGCVMGHKCGFHGKFKMSCLPKMDSEIFWTNFFEQGVKLHQGNIFGDQKCEKTSLISVYLHIFF